MRYNKIEDRHIIDIESIVGSERISTGISNLELHSKDQSQHPPSLPEAVVWPIDRAEVSEILKYANSNLLPVTGWGSGSSLEGNPIPIFNGFVLDFSLMNRVIEIKESDFQADVEPDVVF